VAFGIDLAQRVHRGSTDGCFWTKCRNQPTVIGGGTGGAHGPRPLHFFFWGAWPPHLLISNFA